MAIAQRRSRVAAPRRHPRDTAEGRRLEEARLGGAGGRVGPAWEYFPHDHARSRAYRWGEDGLAAFGDEHLFLCLGLALWNGSDPILKERLFGLTNSQGNHGEDVKELYYHLDGTP